MKTQTKKVILLQIVIFLFLIPSVTAILGTFEKESNVDLIQTCNNCTYCNLTSIKFPNGSNIVNNVEMDQDGTYFNYLLIKNYTEEVGTYIYCYDCGNTDEKATGCIDFDVTLSGAKTPEGVSYVLVGIIIVLFGISCIFLYLSDKMMQPAPKIFLLLAGFVFLLGCVSTMSVIAFDSNLTSGVNTTVAIMLYALGLIFFVIFAYVMIKQTIEALELYRNKKGFDMDL